MTALDQAIAAMVAAEVERRIADLRRPEFVHQRSVEALLGIPGRQYLRDARALAFASTKRDRLIIARYDEVRAYYAPRPHKERPAAANDEVRAFAKARTAIRRVG